MTTVKLTTDPVLVRRLRREDRTGWLRLWADYHAYGRGATALPCAVTELTWERFFAVHEPMEALVAERERRLVGFAHIVFHPSASAATPSCFLQDLFVEAALHGRGVRRALVEAVYDHPKAVGAGRVYWHVLETNVTALRLYDKVASRSGHVVYRKDL